MNHNSSWTAQYAAENSSQPLLNVCISFAILETFFIIAFIFSWYFNDNNSRNTKWVLYLILVGYLFCFGGVVLGILKITMGGAGYHAKTLHPRTIRTMLQLIKSHEFVYISSIPLPKLAILLLYHRLFTSKVIHYIIYIASFIIIATFLFGLVSAFANCRPFSSFWNRNLHGRCTMDVMTVFRYYSIPNIASDAVLLMIPLPALRKLQVNIFTKIGLYITFLTMAFGIVTATLRFVNFLKTDIFEDITYQCVSTTSWTIIEPGVYLIAATMPTLRPLIRRMFKQASESLPANSSITSCFRQSSPSPPFSEPVMQPPRAMQKKSSKSMHREFFETIGRRPSRTIELNDYHQVRRPGFVTPRSMDEESLVCADAITQERFAREGRNPDGTLTGWSLQPLQMSPLRASFLSENK